METANTDYPIHPLLAGRWSPYSFSPRDVPVADLCSVLEAARWAPSSYNEQPWSFIVARKSDAAEFQQLLSCLVEGNRGWAAHVPVLMLTVVKANFSHNQKPNRAAHHDIGLAAANLTVEATQRGLAVHQMIGIEPEKAREVYRIPEGYEALTALALGYAGPADDLPAEILKRDAQRRPRKKLSEFVYSGNWNTSAKFLKA